MEGAPGQTQSLCTYALPFPVCIALQGSYAFMMTLSHEVVGCLRVIVYQLQQWKISKRPIGKTANWAHYSFFPACSCMCLQPKNADYLCWLSDLDV